MPCMLLIISLVEHTNEKLMYMHAASVYVARPIKVHDNYKHVTLSWFADGNGEPDPTFSCRLFVVTYSIWMLVRLSSGIFHSTRVIV